MPALSVNLKDSVFTELITVAEENDVSRSSLVNEALKEYLTKFKYLQGLEQSYQQFNCGQVVIKSLEELEAMAK